MSELMHDPEALAERLRSLIESHRRFAGEFEKSLANARHFIRIADKAMAQEPENTIMLLEQIREIDLLGHVQRLQEELDGMQGVLAASPSGFDPAPYADSLSDLADRYETLEAEAAQQADTIERLLTALEN